MLETGYHFVQEYELKPFIFDFALPKLRLLIEVDSVSYHHTPQQLSRDKRKSAFATKAGWEVARVRVGRSLDSAVIRAVMDREAELGITLL